MSFAPNVGYLLLYTARLSDLEFQMNLITDNQRQLNNIAVRLSSLAASTNPLSPSQLQFNARLAALQQQDKALRITFQKYRSEYEAVRSLLDGIKKVISKNIEMSFKTFA